MSRAARLSVRCARIGRIAAPIVMPEEVTRTRAAIRRIRPALLGGGAAIWKARRAILGGGVTEARVDVMSMSGAPVKTRAPFTRTPADGTKTRAEVLEVRAARHEERGASSRDPGMASSRI